MLAWLWYLALFLIAYEIRLTASGEIEFKSVLRSIKMDARGLESIRPAQFGLDPYTLVFKSGTHTARTLRQMDGLSALIFELRAINPHLDLRGL